MTNQAAQTMPELPEPQVMAGYHSMPTYYTSAQLRAYGQACYAASLSQTAGVAVSDEMVERACKDYALRVDGALWPDAYDEHEVLALRAQMREFLLNAIGTAPAASGGEADPKSPEYEAGFKAGMKFSRDNFQPPAAASVSERARKCPACKGAGEVMLPVRTPDPQDGYDALGTCPKCGGSGSALPKALQDLLYFTEHCLSAADEGVDYSTSREWLDAMTTMGVMKKTGRGKWAPSDQAQPVADALRAIEQALTQQQAEVEQLRLDLGHTQSLLAMRNDEIEALTQQRGDGKLDG